MFELIKVEITHHNVLPLDLRLLLRQLFTLQLQAAHGRREFIISDLYMLIAGLGDSILIYDPPSLINNDRQLERVQ